MVNLVINTRIRRSPIALISVNISEQQHFVNMKTAIKIRHRGAKCSNIFLTNKKRPLDILIHEDTWANKRRNAMRRYHWNAWVILLVLSLLTMGQWGCHGLKFSPEAKLKVIPEEIAITKAILKRPVQFSGWGYGPEEYIVVDLIIPKGIKIKKVPEGEDSVGIAFAIADESGVFKATMGAKDTLDWLFQVGWTKNQQPIFEEATPLPPGTYKIRATGVESELSGMATMTIVPPSE
jgi:hypothetical protein